MKQEQNIRIDISIDSLFISEYKEKLGFKVKIIRSMHKSTKKLKNTKNIIKERTSKCINIVKDSYQKFIHK